MKVFRSSVKVLAAAAVLAVLLFPLVSGSWELFAPSLRGPFSSLFWGKMDAGGQSAFSRACLNALLMAAGILHCVRAWPKRTSPAGTAALGFLLLGLLSCLFSQHKASAFLEWETWAALVLFGLCLARSSGMNVDIVRYGLYLLVGFVIGHSFWMAAQTGVDRLGGVFHHPNALSTFCVLCFPYLCVRAASDQFDVGLASVLGGFLLSLQFWTASLSGYSTLGALLVYWSVRGSQIRRIAWGVLAFFVPFIVGVVGSDFRSWFLPLLICLALGLALSTSTEELPRSARVQFGVAVLLGCLFFSCLPSRGQGVVKGRAHSVGSRWSFYQAGIRMLAERPLWGHGPRGFVRSYPRHQQGVRYYSKFVHNMVLEVSVEWGLLALLLAGGCWYWSFELLEVSGRYTLVGLSLHSLTGVQSQFPYLLALFLVLCSLIQAEAKDGQRGSKGAKSVMVLKGFLLSLLVVGIGFQLSKVRARYDRNLAQAVLAADQGPSSKLLVDRLMSSSLQSNPIDTDSLLAWSRFLAREGETTRARGLLFRVLELESDWAAAWEMLLESDLRVLTPEMVDSAIDVDPVNYPNFYRMKAEVLCRQGQWDKALAYLEGLTPTYSHTKVATLFPARRRDLEERLAEFYLLKAVLHERKGQLKDCEAAFRSSLLQLREQPRLGQALIQYPRRSGISAGPLVRSWLKQLSAQFPVSKLPASGN